MNIQAYIESGILEEYVLGTVSPQEKQEVECMSHIYPEIKEELMRTESALEQYALKHQTPPPPSLKETLFAQMNFDDITERTESVESTGIEPTLVLEDGDIKKLPVESDLITEARPAAGQKTYTDFPAENSEATVLYPSWAKFAVAASILFAVLFGWAALQMSDARKQNEQYAEEMNSLKSDMDVMKNDAEYKEALAGLYRNPNHKVVRMEGLPKSPGSAVAAIWDTKTNDILLDVQNLPATPVGKQYQLWTIVNGKPVDMGVLDQEFSHKVLKMKQANPGAVAFAITLEKAGGSPSPTMEDMFVMGKV